MREMTKEEQMMYQILRDHPECRKNNWEAVREFYWQYYQINLPKLDKTLAIWTIERMIRTLKSLFHECNDEEAKMIKSAMESEYKEQALDKNKPFRPEEVKYEDIPMKWW